MVSSNSMSNANNVLAEDMDYYYRIHIFCCTNERPEKHWRGCCSAKNSKDLCDYMCRLSMSLGQRDIRVNHAGCLNRCELGPVLVIYPDGIWYNYKTEKDVEEILRSHVMKGIIVSRLLLRPEEGKRH